MADREPEKPGWLMPKTRRSLFLSHLAVAAIALFACVLHRLFLAARPIGTFHR